MISNEIVFIKETLACLPMTGKGLDQVVTLLNEIKFIEENKIKKK